MRTDHRSSAASDGIRRCEFENPKQHAYPELRFGFEFTPCYDTISNQAELSCLRTKQCGELRFTAWVGATLVQVDGTAAYADQGVTFYRRTILYVTTIPATTKTRLCTIGGCHT